MAIEHIVITGPESTGKTTLAARLATEWGTLWVPEFARYYLQLTGPKYDYPDLALMLEGQNALELTGGINKPLVCDTDWLTFYIWGKDKFGKYEPWWIPADTGQRLYLLCYPDLPWQPDRLREDPKRLKVIFDQYRRALKRFGLDYAIVRGAGPARLQAALLALP